MKVFSNGLAILKEGGMVGVLKMNDNETMIWKEKEINAAQMDNLKGLLGIRRVDKVSNSQIREFCGVRKD